MNLTRRLAPALLMSLAGAPAFGQVDPAATGPLAVTRQEYTQGDTAFTPAGFPGPVEFTAVVHHPTDLTRGPYPVVLYLHGRHGTCVGAFTWPCPAGVEPIRSYQGYEYSGQQLASHGYIVVSISANGINARDNGVTDLGAAARAELIDRHLEFWRTLHSVGAPPFASQFVGRVDLTRVGTMGHSRGGEGIMRHVSYNAAKAQPFPLKMLVPIAPTNFSRWQVNQNVAVAQFLPYCDGDVSDLQGVHYYDDARYQMTGSGYQNYVTVMGANHNFFNSVWTPPAAGASDDWGLTADPHCGTGAGNGRLTAPQQRAVGLAYLATFFRAEVGRESGLFGYVDGSFGRPPTVSAFNLHVSYQGNNSRRHDLNRLLTAADLTTNFLGGASSQTGLTPHDLCGGELPQPLHCLAAGQSTARQPHTTPSARSSLRGMSQLRSGWSATTASYVNQIPAGAARNVSPFGFLQFRATVNFTDTRNPAGTAQDLRVRFTDGAGANQVLRVGQFSNALFYPPGTSGAVPKVLQNTIRLPLASVTGVNLTDLAEVAFLFDQQPSGALLVSDLHFSGSRPAAAELVSPPPGSTLTGPAVTFSWTAGSGVSQYWLWIGSSPATADLYTASQGAATSGTVSGLPVDGRTLYVRLWSLIGSTWQFRDYTYTAFTTPVPAQMVSPPPGSTLGGPSVTFTWTTGVGVSQYWLWIGSAPATADLYTASQGTATSGTVSGLPVDGRTLHVRLWSLIGSAWQFRDYTYTAFNSPAAVLVSPPPGSRLPGPSVTFTWTTGVGVSQYWLWIGSSLGTADIYTASQGTATSGTVSGLPVDGRTLHVRLWSFIGSTWLFRDFTYLAAGTPAAMVSPPPGSRLGGSTVTFTWTTGSGVSQYWLFVGSSPGTADIYTASQGTATSGTVSGLPTDGRPLFVRLWSFISPSWQFRDYTYTAF